MKTDALPPDLDSILHESNSSLDTEESRLVSARKELPDIANRFDPLLSKLYVALADQATNAIELATRFGRALLLESINTPNSADLIVDDRSLYWSRLMGLVLIRTALSTRLSASPELILKASELFERESRIRLNDTPDRAQAEKQPIFLSCFDPFTLDNNLAQSNPSAVIAFSLCRERICGHPVAVAVFPVRYDDFDAGIVESSFKPVFLSSVRLVLTISMGRDRFDLERFPGRRRSSSAPDNRGRIGPVDNKPTPCMDGPEFLEFSLPATSMSMEKGDWKVVDNRHVSTEENGDFDATSLVEITGQTAVNGSGGGFLSNEIAYRTLLLQAKLNRQFPLGHLHVPRISDYEPKTLSNMTSQTRSLIVAALEST
ncbi:MAG: hypothetical protein F4X44_05020 [Gammaproteobacteria bacterium]|nr:hypothetical protein [Gammaproteobacteria bacterium]MYD79953.1 hypothetical protein [Gammaproteobacteria bacterium]